MARTSRPWYFTEKKAYAAVVKGRRVILLKGEESDANFHQRQENQAREALRDVADWGQARSDEERSQGSKRQTALHWNMLH